MPQKPAPGGVFARGSKEWADRFCEKAFLLEKVTQNQKPLSRPAVNPKSGAFEAETRPYNWLYKPDQGLELYYVPLEYFP